MKRFLSIIVCLFIFLFLDTKIFNNTLYNMYDDYRNNDIKIVSNKDLLNKNKYYKDNLSDKVKETDDFVAKNKNDLLNIYYTAINNGYDNLTFYCSEDYVDCMKDINNLDGKDNDFSYINQLVNVYNTYSTIESVYSSDGKVNIKINKKYSKDDINKIDNKIDEIINELNINEYSNLNDKIKLFHDYIARTNKYDQEMADTKQSKYHSDSAIGTLFEGYSVCSGYSDTLSIFLDKLGITNIRIANDKHVWNALNVNGNWYHIDLTWDDPITSNGSDIIIYSYYMISTDELISKKDNEHNFDRNIYDFIN